MIISKTPLRASFFGGGTDFPEFFNEFNGKVISTTIDKAGIMNFSNVEWSNVNKYSTEQSNIEDFKDLVTRIKNVF